MKFTKEDSQNPAQSQVLTDWSWAKTWASSSAEVRFDLSSSELINLLSFTFRSINSESELSCLSIVREGSTSQTVKYLICCVLTN